MVDVAKPFIQWQGGKTRLLPSIRRYYPEDIKAYAEPFLGGGAVLFDVLSYFDVKRVYVSDVNHKLICAYQTVRDNVDALIARLNAYRSAYSDATFEDKERLYYEWRTRYNAYTGVLERDSKIDASALFILLTVLCYNGLYRVNSKGNFNASFGKHKNPSIFNEDNLKECSRLLQNAEIVHGSYEKSEAFIADCVKEYGFQTFCYFDPPYRPVKTPRSQYTVSQFNDDDQRRLAKYAWKLRELRATILLSNSNPKETNPDDTFFDGLYWGFYYEEVSINRNICSNKEKRGSVTELFISNKEPRQETNLFTNLQ